MKLLAVCSSLDLRLPYSCTPAWWQLLKGLAETGVDISAVAYAGETVESLWWKAYPNPCLREGAAFAAGRNLLRRLPVPGGAAQSDDSAESLSDRLTRGVASHWVMPRWRAHLDGIIRR